MSAHREWIVYEKSRKCNASSYKGNIQDDRSGRMSVLLPRTGWGGYALAQAFSAAGGAFLCMLGGVLLFYIFSRLLVRAKKIEIR